MNPTIRQITSILSALVLLALAGCETTKVAQDPAAKRSIKNLESAFTVQRGTSAADLIQHLGEPQRRYPFEKHDVEAEVWVYERTVATDSELVIMDTQTRFYFDRSENEMVPYEEPVYGHQVSSNVEITEILLVDNVVSAWKRRSQEENTVAGNAR